MAIRNPLGKIKDLTKGAASVGLHVAGQATRTATSLTSGTVGKLVGGKKSADDAPSGTVTPTPTAKKAPAKKAPAKKAPATRAPAATAPPTEPVNVTEELGLDPAPVDEPRATTGTPGPTDAGEPVTTIDAAADAENVEATPADIAKAVAKKAPARKPAAKKAPAARKSPAKKTAPGAKLPPRRPVEQAEETTSRTT